MGKPKKIYKNVDLITNEKLALKINIWTIALTVLFLILFSFIRNLLPTINEVEYRGIVEGILLIVFMFLIIIVHELIHGLFFKIFSPGNKVNFGFKNGFAYAGSFESVYNKGPYAVIILAPFVIITLALILAYILGWLSSYLFVLLTGIHAGMSTGDFYYILLLIKAPKGVRIEDTPSGMTIYYA